MYHPSLHGRPRALLDRLHPVRDLGDAWRWLRFRHAVGRLSEQIRIELRESPQAYTVLASLPGARKDEVEVALDGNRVRIRNRASVEHAAHDGAGVLRRERYLGRRSRTLTLPQAIDATQARAEFRHGVLELVLPKLGQPRGVQVPVL